MTQISVIIPSYNHQHFIGEAVQSVLNQTNVDLELIVVDDGSSDGSLQLLRGYADGRMTVIEQANAGAHNAINRGLELAKGDFLAVLNSDDVFHSDRLSTCIGELERTKADLAATWIDIIDKNGVVLGTKEGWSNMQPWPIPATAESFLSSGDFAMNLLVSNFVSTTSNMVFTRRLFNDIGGMRNLRFAHDWDFLFRAVEKFDCILIDQPLMKYRVHGSNTISSNRAWMLFEICWVLATGTRRFEGVKFYADEQPSTWLADAIKLHSSINLQGNDKVFWMIRQFISSMERRNIDSPELILLEDDVLRKYFIDNIVTDHLEDSNVQEVRRSDSLLDRARPYLGRLLGHRFT